jgi:hypothetical protein
MSWATKLREYTGKQAFGTFVDNQGGRCALEVIDPENSREMVRMSMHNSFLSGAPLHYLDLKGVFFCPECGLKDCSLAIHITHMNDSHLYTFKQIADIIEPLEQEYRVTQLDPEDEKEKVCAWSESVKSAAKLYRGGHT